MLGSCGTADEGPAIALGWCAAALPLCNEEAAEAAVPFNMGFVRKLLSFPFSCAAFRPRRVNRRLASPIECECLSLSNADE